MNSASEVKVLVLEPDHVTAEFIAEALRRHTAASAAEVSVTRVHHTIDDVIAELDTASEDSGPTVLLAGPGCPAAALAPFIGTLLTRKIRTIVLANSQLDEPGSQLLLAGASGYLLLEGTEVATIVEAVVNVARGETSLHPDVVHAVLERWRQMRTSTPAPNSSITRRQIDLTAREREVLEGLRDGLTNRALAARLGLAEKTVENHRTRLYAKLGARNQTHAVRIALDEGLLPPG